MLACLYGGQGATPCLRELGRRVARPGLGRARPHSERPARSMLTVPREDGVGVWERPGTRRRRGAVGDAGQGGGPATRRRHEARPAAQLVGDDARPGWTGRTHPVPHSRSETVRGRATLLAKNAESFPRDDRDAAWRARPWTSQRVGSGRHRRHGLWLAGPLWTSRCGRQRRPLHRHGRHSTGCQS